MELPSPNNVYGSFRSGNKLDRLAKIIMREFSDSLVEIRVKRSSYSGIQTLTMVGVGLDFESIKFEEENDYGFNGAVAGDKETVESVVGELYAILDRHGYDPRFEIYDSDFTCVRDFGY